jgi:hypothetical protein
VDRVLPPHISRYCLHDCTFLSTLQLLLSFKVQSSAASNILSLHHIVTGYQRLCTACDQTVNRKLQDEGLVDTQYLDRQQDIRSLPLHPRSSWSRKISASRSYVKPPVVAMGGDDMLTRSRRGRPARVMVGCGLRHSIASMPRAFSSWARKTRKGV